MRTFAIASLLVVTACADDAHVVYDPCSPLTLALAPDVEAPQRAGVEGAISAWSRVLPVRITIAGGARDVDVLPISFVPGDQFYRATYWDAKGVITVAADALAHEDYAIAIAHELGHAFGLPHVPRETRDSVMNVSNLEISPNHEDAAELRTRWSSCPSAD